MALIYKITDNCQQLIDEKSGYIIREGSSLECCVGLLIAVGYEVKVITDKEIHK